MLQQDKIMGKLWLNNESIDRLAIFDSIGCSIEGYGDHWLQH